MISFEDPAPGSSRRWVILVIGSLNFVLSMFYRVSVAVISPALIREMDMTSGQLSDLSAAFYYAFAAGQIPLGIAIDRFGPRRSMCVLAVAAIAGAVFFAVGETPGHLIAARALLGIGMSGNMMVLLALVAVWFPVDRFASLSGMAIAVGALGNLLAATPLALLSLTVGWRGCFLIFAAINLVVVVTYILVIRDHPDGTYRVRTTPEPLLRGFVSLTRMFSFWAISVSNFVRYGFFAALQSLWLGPFLVFGMGRSEVEAGNALLFVGIGYMAGLPLWGSISDGVLKSRKKVVLPTMVVFCLVTFSFLLWDSTVPSFLVMAVFFLLGFLAAPGQILYAHIKELVPPSMVARAMTSVNLFTILGVGAMIHFLGFFLGDNPASLKGLDGYRLLWYVGGISIAVVCVLYSFVPDTCAKDSRTDTQ